MIVNKKVQEVILKKINEYLEVKLDNNIKLNKQFLEVGINSVKFIEIIVSLEQEFNIEYEDKILMLGALNTISNFIEYTNYRCNNK